MAGLKIPLWMFGWALNESLERYPKVLTASEIQKRLGVAKNTATLIKRRLQLLAAEHLPKLNARIYQDLEKNLGNVNFPREDDKDLSKIIAGKAIPQVDTCALYSTSSRANGGRKRWKHGGLTASIYMSDKLGGEQKGILVQTLAWKNGPVIYQSVPDNRGETLRPMLDKYIPKNVPVFTDEGYKFYYRINKNHRMINHSLKSKDKRHRFSRERWSRHGINTQCVEGHNRNLKHNFGSGYGYIKPKWSQLYLDEYAFWRNVRYYGWEALLVGAGSEGRGAGSGGGELGNFSAQTTSRGEAASVGFVRNNYPRKTSKISESLPQHFYQALTLEDRKVKSQPLYRNRRDQRIQALLKTDSSGLLAAALKEFSEFWPGSQDFQRAKQKQYAHIAAVLWENLPGEGWCSLSEMLDEIDIDRKKSYRILRKWFALNLIELIDRSSPTAVNLKYEFDIRKKQPTLPDLLYVLDRSNLKEFNANARTLIPKTYVPKKARQK
ncbi:transposase [Turneriella parva]|uniref:transposase n=1 Tax=Turneriella parva TaxID=29510 RepID=UPI0012F69C06|nr:transposase [Turneriella parva]